MMHHQQSQHPRRSDKVSSPLRRAFDTDPVERDLPDAFEALLDRMRGGAPAEDRVEAEE